MDHFEEIKKKIDLVEYVGKLVSLKKAGRNFVACCPFHSEKTPSFVISPERQIWHCFGACGEGGDIFKFLQKWENITFREAVKQLADQTGVEISDFKVEDQSYNQKQKILAINEAAAEFYHYLLTKHPFGQAGRDYLSKRGVSDKTAVHFRLGYSPRSWNSLERYLLKKGFLKADLIRSGLIIQGNKGTYDRFRGR
jgi:DNA primase